MIIFTQYAIPTSFFHPRLPTYSWKKMPLRVFWPLQSSNSLNLGQSKCHNQGYSDFHRDELVAIQRFNENEKDDIEEMILKVTTSSEVKKIVENITLKLKSMSDGETNISPYNTAWVALVKDTQGMKEVPQFPSSLKWIIDNQLKDGSWGDHLMFSSYDRIINTLACLIALKSWGVCPNLQEKGIAFLKENMDKLENEKDEHMLAGFEVIVPTLIEIAEKLGIEVSKQSPALEKIYAERKLKLSRVPWESMHMMHTTLLSCLEGMSMSSLDWKRLLKLQCQDGSFLHSPSSTAFALMQTKDLKCLNYLNKVIKKFNGGAPDFSPMDLFERIWVVDRLQRLGISRYFQEEIKETMTYIYRYWTEKGIGWARNLEVQDLDDTAMGFRLLRLHGYQVSADVFKNFVKDGEFLCTSCQSKAGVSVTYNLLRASELEYDGEKILEHARNYAITYLREKQSSNHLFDKWFIAKDLPGEVAYALDIPWYANLSRVETRFYIEQYGGANDVWIGKTLFRMPNINNNAYLELAKMDYNNCQELHKLEFDSIIRWYTKNNLEDFGVSQRSLLLAYFVASATIFEPENSKERLAWAKTATLVEAIASSFSHNKERKAFVLKFQKCHLGQGFLTQIRAICSNNKGHELVGSLLSTLNELSIDALVAHGRDMRIQLYEVWVKWLRAWEEEGDKSKGEAELFVHTIEICGGRYMFEHIMVNASTNYLLDTTNQMCQLLANIENNKKVEESRIHSIRKMDVKVDKCMQKLVELVLCNKSLEGVDSNIKETCLIVAKTFYYKSYCSPQEIDDHIAKVLFQKVN